MVDFRPYPHAPAYIVGDDGTIWRTKYFNTPRRHAFSPAIKLIPKTESLNLRIGIRTNTRRTSFILGEVLLETFLSPREPGYEVNHLDNNQNNNAIDNLAWGKISYKPQPIFSEQDSDMRLRYWSQNGPGYAINKNLVDGEMKSVFAHRIILERMLSRKLVKGELVDHKNRNPLDCRRENLRLTDYSGNAQNSPRAETKYYGTSWNKKTRKWSASITIKRKRISLGYYAAREKATEVAKAARIKHGFLCREKIL